MLVNATCAYWRLLERIIAHKAVPNIADIAILLSFCVYRILVASLSIHAGVAAPAERGGSGKYQLPPPRRPPPPPRSFHHAPSPPPGFSSPISVSIFASIVVIR
jgi:hypothetical protein